MSAPARTPDASDVAVIVPTRNRRRLLELALASVLAQHGVSLDVIVIDEGSSDGTSAMLASVGDPRVRVVRHDVARGKSAARNRGIAETGAPWVAFLDDDDIWAPDKLRLQLEALGASGRQWCYTGAVNITEDHRILGGAPPRPPEDVAEALPHVNGVPGGCSGVLVSRTALPPDGFDARYRLCEDWDLWIRLAQRGLPACVPRPLVGYRVHSGNSSVDAERFLAELEIIESRYGGPVDRVVFYRHLARVSLRMNRQWPALRYYLRAAAHDRRGYLLRGVVPDAMGVLQAAVDRARARLGRPRSPARARQRADPHEAWKAEARIWLEQFVRQHAV